MLRLAGETGRRLFALSSILAASLTVAAAQAESPPPETLFGSHEILRLTVRAPLRALVGQIDEEIEIEQRGSIALDGGPDIPITAGVFGKSRLEHCTMPPLVLGLDPEAARGTLFEGHPQVRIITHCGHESGSDRWALLEYLVYRSYQIFAETALSVRLAEIEYHDTRRKASKEVAYGFLVQEISLAARERGLGWLTFNQQPLTAVDPDQSTILALFQFMVGNTDWSMLHGPEGERCCHNLAVLGREDSSERHLLPFDFDQAGVVDAPYSKPSKKLNLRDVRQRRYRGFCAFNDRLPTAIDLFNERRPLIEELFNDDSLPQPKTRQRALRYLVGFYDVINHPKKLDKHILQRCRGKRAG